MGKIIEGNRPNLMRADAAAPETSRIDRIEARLEAIAAILERRAREYEVLYGQYCSMIAWNQRLLAQLDPEAIGRATAAHMAEVADKRDT